jgi:hypothetical protein
MTLKELETLTRDFSDARARLAVLVGEIQVETQTILRNHMTQIKRCVAWTAERQDRLRAAIESNPSLFEQPRTQIFHGVKIGYRKATGSIQWDDDDQVVKLIEKHLADQVDALVKTEKRPIKKALEQLSVAELKKIACEAVEAGDVVVIKPVDDGVDSIVKALLKDALEETGPFETKVA